MELKREGHGLHIIHEDQFIAAANAEGSVSSPSNDRAHGVGQIFQGQTWAVTGSFENFKPRTTAMEEVKRRGGKVVTSVTGKTTHLLAGEGAGSKIEKALEAEIRIVSE